jgi:hypothetical protein
MTNSVLFGQSDIKINGNALNKVDKKNKKQGNWIFFDSAGNIRLTTYYEDDKIITPLIFYENSDTAFVRFPRKDNSEIFIYYNHNFPVSGSFIYDNDSTFSIEIDSAYINNVEVLSQIRNYNKIVIRPIYMFGQKKMADYLSAAYFSANFFLNKPIYAILYLSSAGKVINVDFPGDKNTLHVNEENELGRIYRNMPRWQPLFSDNDTKVCRIIISGNHTITDLY